MHHRLGFELPERTGFGGLWSAMDPVDDDDVPAPAANEEPRHWVARSHGASRPQVRKAILALESAVAA